MTLAGFLVGVTHPTNASRRSPQVTHPLGPARPSTCTGRSSTAMMGRLNGRTASLGVFNGREMRMDGLDPSEFDLVTFLFRVLVGLTFASHGWAKMFRGGRIAGTAGWFDSIGMRPGRVHAMMASITEMASGILLALGLLTPFAAAAIVGVMVVAGWTVHRSSGFFIVSGGWEYTFIVALMAVAIAGLGPGDWSVDEALGIAADLNGYTGLAIAAVLGIGAGIAQLAIFYRPPAATAEA